MALEIINEIVLHIPQAAMPVICFETVPIHWFEYAGEKWVMRRDFLEASGFARSSFKLYPGEDEALNTDVLRVKTGKAIPAVAVNRAWIEAFVKSGIRRRRKQKKVYDFLRRELWGEEISEQGTLFTPRLTDADAKEFAERVWQHFEKMLNTYGG